MRQILFLTLLLFTATPLRAACAPSNIQIVGADPCGVMPLIEAEWRTVLKRIWFVEHVNELFYGTKPRFPTERLADMGRIKFVAHPGETFYDPAFNAEFYGIFTPGSTPTIDYAEGTPSVLRHEMAHWYYWKFKSLYGERIYLQVGHQVEGDPFLAAWSAIWQMWYE